MAMEKQESLVLVPRKALRERRPPRRSTIRKEQQKLKINKMTERASWDAVRGQQ